MTDRDKLLIFPESEVRALVEAARALKFDVWEITAPELRATFDGRKNLVVAHAETVLALRAALAHPALRAFIGSEK
jgi:hypothetical protein